MENSTVLDSLEQWPVSIALASFSFDRFERQKILKMSPKDLVRQLPLAITPNGTLSHAPDDALCTKPGLQLGLDQVHFGGCQMKMR